MPIFTEPPPLRSLTLRIVAFVAHRPSPAIAQAVRQTRRGASVLVLAPPSERERVLAMGAQWSNLTAASEATGDWAARYRHSSGNPRAYELFCLQRWLMLLEAVRPMGLAADAALAVLDDDMLLYRSAAMWLRELGATPPHAESQTAGVMGVAFQLHSIGTLHRFCSYLRWLYEQPTSKLAREIVNYGVGRPLASLSARQRHAMAGGLVAMANRSWPGQYRHWSDVQAMDAFCRRSAEGKLAAGIGGARCSLMEHERVRVAQGADLRPSFAAQPANCSAFYLANVGPGSVLQFFAMARPAPPHVVGGGSAFGGASSIPAAAAAAAARAGLNESVASQWAAGLRWKAGTPYAPDAHGRLHSLCLAHLQGPWSKQLFMEALTAPAARRALLVLQARNGSTTTGHAYRQRERPRLISKSSDGGAST